MDYYNEWDAYAAEWLRNLQEDGHLPPGRVDERSIEDVRPKDLEGARQVHFFAGIGGWPLALRLAGWPEEEPVWTGSCPCQPFSIAGSRKGTKDRRHLWPEFRRLIAECGPSTVFGEQVASPLGRRWFSRVRADLENLGYGVGALDLCAAGVGAPHIRQRLFWVAYGDREGLRLLRSRHDENGSHAPGDHADGCRSVDRMAHPPNHNGRPRERRTKAGAREEEFGWRGSSGRSAHDRMGHAVGSGLQGDEPEIVQGSGRRKERGAVAESSEASGAIWLGNSSRGGCGVGRYETQQGDGRHALNTIWTGSKTVECRDGKLRRVPLEPSLFPLAPRVPGRVGLLRGAGGAIVPQVAAEFIKAFLEVTRD